MPTDNWLIVQSYFLVRWGDALGYASSAMDVLHTSRGLMIGKSVICILASRNEGRKRQGAEKSL